MSVCVAGSASDGAAVYAAPRSARDIVQRQKRGVNDPGIAPVEPPRAGPGVVHAPLSLSIGPARAGATLRPDRRTICSPNVPGIVHVDYAVDRWSFSGAHTSCSCD